MAAFRLKSRALIVAASLILALSGCRLGSAARTAAIQINPDHSLGSPAKRPPSRHLTAYRPTVDQRGSDHPIWLAEKLNHLWQPSELEQSQVTPIFLVSGETQVFQPSPGIPQQQLPAPMMTAPQSIPEQQNFTQFSYPEQPGIAGEEIYPRFSFREDYSNLLGVFNSDFQALLEWRNFAYLGIAIGGTILTSEFLDDQVADNVAEHPKRWGTASEVLELMGEFPVQFPALSAFYYLSLRNQDEDMHSLAMALFSAYKFSGGGAWLIKLLTDTQRPSDGLYDGHWGFPSEEAATSFAMAAVLEEYYGWKAGLPAYTLAGLISWSTIDLQDQYLSDVVFGAAFGLIIGKTIGRRHFEETYSWQIVPFTSTNPQATGMGLEYRF